MKTPDINRKQNVVNGFISLFIVVVYSCLIIFGMVSLFEPGWLRDLSGTGKVSEATTMHTYGDQFLNREEYDMAIIQYRKALSINPDMSEAWINMGVAMRQQRDYEGALSAFEKALTYENVPHDATLFNMAEIFQEQNNPEQAVSYFLKSALISPFPMISYQKAGEILNNKGRWDRAFEVFNQALENVYTMKNCYRGMLKRDYHLYEDTLVKQNIDRLLKEDVDQTNFTMYDEKAFQDALSSDPHLAGIYNQFGYTFAMKGDYRRAIEYFTKALQIKPNFQNARTNLDAAWNMINKGNQQ